MTLKSLNDDFVFPKAAMQAASHSSFSMHFSTSKGSPCDYLLLYYITSCNAKYILTSNTTKKSIAFFPLVVINIDSSSILQAVAWSI